jgi:hypothetical protein
VVDENTPLGHIGQFVHENYPAKTLQNWWFLCMLGTNGILSLVDLLYWWSCEMCTGSNTKDGEWWAEAVRDVSWMLMGLVEAEAAGILLEGQV